MAMLSHGTAGECKTLRLRHGEELQRDEMGVHSLPWIPAYPQRWTFSRAKPAHSSCF